ncbi:hypothetical protein D0Z07_7198 [Hyphodiscus hymeniophilus]|uniref:Arginase-like protein n=1 Tax=Hyphodiscus hymeniophilus TaxID=353542 RepID=A0A9P7AV20_9HELO|nr:hypothetical protein D0Z07_7198 [Hyphodiscus hymeniophilus]
MSEVIVQRVRTKYHWPAVQLNFWLLIMLIGSGTILGINADFITVQQQLQLGIPWYFPYWITVASLTILFIFVELWLISQRQLLPGIVMMGTFILFILWVVGLIVDSVELWGPSGVNSNCQLYVNAASSRGQSVDTLAYLQQHSICELYLSFVAGFGWTAAWAFELVGCVFLLWMMIMAYQVYSDK